MFIIHCAFIEYSLHDSFQWYSCALFKYSFLNCFICQLMPITANYWHYCSIIVHSSDTENVFQGFWRPIATMCVRGNLRNQFLQLGSSRGVTWHIQWNLELTSRKKIFLFYNSRVFYGMKGTVSRPLQISPCPAVYSREYLGRKGNKVLKARNFCLLYFLEC
jgi:hypothetical protein